MSLLTDTLEQIRAWLQNNYPAGAKHLLIGLNQLQIEEIVQTLPFKSPQEIYELYQWSQGNTEETLSVHTSIFDPYDGMSLCSLERAKELYQHFETVGDELAPRFAGKPLFPVFEFDGSFLAVIGDIKSKNNSPVIFISDDAGLTVRYVSLTSMMLTLAECFETGAAYITSEFLKYSEEKFSPIYRKHNSGLLKLALARLKQEIELNRSKSKVLVEIAVDNFSAQVWELTRYWQSVDQFSSEDTEALMAARQDEDKLVREAAEQALAILNGNF